MGALLYGTIQCAACPENWVLKPIIKIELKGVPG